MLENTLKIPWPSEEAIRNGIQGCRLVMGTILTDQMLTRVQDVLPRLHLEQFCIQKCEEFTPGVMTGLLKILQNKPELERFEGEYLGRENDLLLRAAILAAFPPRLFQVILYILHVWEQTMIPHLVNLVSLSCDEFKLAFGGFDFDTAFILQWLRAVQRERQERDNDVKPVCISLLWTAGQEEVNRGGSG